MSPRERTVPMKFLQGAFGPQVEVHPVVDEGRMGRRITGIDLSRPPTGEQADALIAALDEWQIVSIPNQHDMTVFRYDHPHQPGDVTIWSNYATLHVAPPSKKFVNDPADARLMYRISCKGPVSTTLPRPDTDEWIQANITPAYRSPIS
jgi:alpha-ketoglutarate-dependent taurine dioxygenase